MRRLWLREIGEQESVGDFKSMETGEQKLRMKKHELLDKAQVLSTFPTPLKQRIDHAKRHAKMIPYLIR